MRSRPPRMSAFTPDGGVGGGCFSTMPPSTSWRPAQPRWLAPSPSRSWTSSTPRLEQPRYWSPPESPNRSQAPVRLQCGQHRQHAEGGVRGSAGELRDTVSHASHSRLRVRIPSNHRFTAKLYSDHDAYWLVSKPSAGRGGDGPGRTATGDADRRGDRGSYCQARKLRQRAGWQLWLGGQDWATITFAEVRGDDVLNTVADGRIFRADYMDAVRCRPPQPRPG
jgi:hypothetical protein